MYLDRCILEVSLWLIKQFYDCLCKYHRLRRSYTIWPNKDTAQGRYTSTRSGDRNYSYLTWRIFPITLFPFATLSWILRLTRNSLQYAGQRSKRTYMFVNEKPAIQYATTQACTRDSTLHFVKLNSRQIQIIKQTPNILLAKIYAYMVRCYALQRKRLNLLCTEVSSKLFYSLTIVFFPTNSLDKASKLLFIFVCVRKGYTPPFNSK